MDWTATTSDGQTLQGSDVGAGSDAVVLLHGLSQQRYFWDPVCSYLQAPRIIRLDQRGHGLSDTPVEVDYSIERCALDAVEVMDALSVTTATVIGHSWGGAVAARLGAMDSSRVRTIGLLDGGLRGPADMGDRAEVRERLRPPALNIPADELWHLIATGDLGPYWSEEIRSALTPTFTEADGLLRTRIGIDRHMQVLDGLLDYDGVPDIRARRLDTWAVLCTDSPTLDPLVERRLQMIGELNLQIWQGAIHDVPLQWPALVAGWITTVHSAAGEGVR
ncbi:MAG: alpha/beta fold hydrolase [Candidatus Nanopelagicales bacterium]